MVEQKPDSQLALHAAALAVLAVLALLSLQWILGSDYWPLQIDDYWEPSKKSLWGVRA